MLCYRINMADPVYDNGEYVCEVSNTLCGQTQSKTTVLRVSGAKPVVTSKILELSGQLQEK